MEAHREKFEVGQSAVMLYRGRRHSHQLTPAFAPAQGICPQVEKRKGDKIEKDAAEIAIEADYPALLLI